MLLVCVLHLNLALAIHTHACEPKLVSMTSLQQGLGVVSNCQACCEKTEDQERLC